MGNTSSKFAGFKDWVEVFASGKQTDSKGRVRDWKNSDLDEMVANHSGGHTAPMVIGHPGTDAPAYGWADQLKRVGSKLMAKFAQVQPAFENMVKTGAFPNRSIKVIPTDKGWKLAHVGWLGAAPPAIEGLAPVQFSAAADADEIYEFAAEAETMQPVELVFRQFVQFLETFSSPRATDPEPSVGDDPTASYSRWDAASRKELADGKRKGDFAGPNQTFPIGSGQDVNDAWGLAGKAADPDAVRKKIIAIAKAHGWTDSLPDTAQQWAKDHSIDFSEAPVDPNAEKKFSQADVDALVAAERKKRETAEGQAAAFAAKQKLDTAKLLVADHVKAGRLSPAQAEGMAEFLASVDDGADFTFAAAAGGAETKKPRGDFLRDFLSKLPVQVEFNKERGGGAGGVDTNSAHSIVAKAQEYQKEQQAKGITVAWHDAVAHVSTKAA